MTAPITTYTNVAGLNRALRKLPKIAAAELRNESGDIAGVIAGKARSRAQAVGGVAELVSPTIRVRRDRVPAIVMGSSAVLSPRYGSARKRGSGRQTVGDVIYGAEFGGGARPSTHTFRPHLGTQGYFLYPTVRAESDATMAAYDAALGRALVKMR